MLMTGRLYRSEPCLLSVYSFNFLFTYFTNKYTYSLAWYRPIYLGHSTKLPFYLQWSSKILFSMIIALTFILFTMVFFIYNGHVYFIYNGLLKILFSMISHHKCINFATHSQPELMVKSCFSLIQPLPFQSAVAYLIIKLKRPVSSAHS